MQHFRLAGFAFFMFLLVFSPLVLADSIWQDDQSVSPYSQQKAYKTGDLVNILILESTSALQKAGTDTKFKDDLSLSLDHTINRLTPSVATTNSLDGKFENDFKGQGATSRSSNIKARVAARVTKVLPNGLLQIAGIHNIAVNEEEQQITITGVIRSKDISMANTVYSYQVANADITIKGKGSVGEAQAPGWITRMLNWIL